MLRRSPALKKFLCLLVGVALIAVVAVPAATGQSTSNKFSPDSVSRKTKPTKAVHKYPWKVTTFGKVKPPHQFCPPGQQGGNNPNFGRNNAIMAAQVQSLSQSDLKDLAAYIESLDGSLVLKK